VHCPLLAHPILHAVADPQEPVERPGNVYRWPRGVGCLLLPLLDACLCNERGVILLGLLTVRPQACGQLSTHHNNASMSQMKPLSWQNHEEQAYSES
jgi:hypothetical protein